MNPEKELVAALAAEFDVQVGVRTPPPGDPAWDSRVIRAYRNGGASTRQLDRVMFDVDCFDVDDSHCSDFALTVRDWFTDTLAHSTVGGMAVTAVQVVAAARRLPWDNTNVVRYGATYQVYAAPAPAV